MSAGNENKDLRHPVEAQRLAEHVAAASHIDVQIDPGFALALIGFLQLAMRHPATKKLHTIAKMREFKDDLIHILAANDSEIEALIRRGDDPNFDQ